MMKLTIKRQGKTLTWIGYGISNDSAKSVAFEINRYMRSNFDLTIEERYLGIRVTFHDAREMRYYGREHLVTLFRKFGRKTSALRQIRGSFQFS